jgi:uncharacterized protein
MSERDGYASGVPCWVTAVEPDPDRAAAFYAGLLGWESEDLMGLDHPASYHMCRLRGRKVAGIVSQHGAPAPPAAVWSTHIWVEDTDDTVGRVERAGGSVVGPAFDSPAGGRMAVLADPAGAVFCVWQPDGHRGAEVVNEPGAWAMSVLQTPDPDRAAEFYGSVFGWTTESFGGMTLWRLPGYVGGEPEQPVSREVIGAMLAASGQPSFWAIDFWVEDSDAAAAAADELGGSVLAAPHDTPGFRRAVLADPAGAAFSVSQLTM